MRTGARGPWSWAAALLALALFNLALVQSTAMQAAMAAPPPAAGAAGPAAMAGTPGMADMPDMAAMAGGPTRAAPPDGRGARTAGPRAQKSAPAGAPRPCAVCAAAAHAPPPAAFGYAPPVAEVAWLAFQDRPSDPAPAAFGGVARARGPPAAA